MEVKCHQIEHFATPGCFIIHVLIWFNTQQTTTKCLMAYNNQ